MAATASSSLLFVSFLFLEKLPLRMHELVLQETRLTNTYGSAIAFNTQSWEDWCVDEWMLESRALGDTFVLPWEMGEQ